MHPKLTANGFVIDQRPEAFGELHDSTADAGDPASLQLRLAEDGYVFLRNVVDKDLLASIRDLMVVELRRRAYLSSSPDPGAELRALPDVNVYGMFPELNRHASVRQIIELKSLIRITSDLFAEQARSLNLVWVRAAGPGRGELPHCDWVYMSRGTDRLLTTWMPVVDVPIERGPLMILEQSHRENPFTQRYLTLDADRLGVLDGLRFKHRRLVHGGRYSRRPDRVRSEFGTRWLTADFKPGDVLLFGPRCLHATLDNRTADFRLSVDTRFQPAADAIDPRFDGQAPVGHSKRDKSLFFYLERLKELFRGRLVGG
jgi:ectoine hydroxylase-related dioxygenase (phytanoyl-CoA dioxygenase family)